ncbi:hypothetical protein CVT25_010394 [Psilocybe cyanescens]|uniref:T6SS Phospholipase effector Tle1-like catalytic domain-containing protein n=1 Tax=Psilocybe cyanescens TaxID=93625 RepID=A0A409XGS9_PSICY|nr:hypothetical protein CVT25_010394 [Psilocybe cyanescens]
MVHHMPAVESLLLTKYHPTDSHHIQMAAYLQLDKIRPLPKDALPAHSSKELFGVKTESFAGTKPHVRQNKPANICNKKGGDVKEVWFAGSHSDIGSGNVKNLKNNQFGPSLRWITYEALHGDCK